MSDTINCKNEEGKLLNSPSIIGTIKLMLRLKLLIQLNLREEKQPAV
jgi:hypothetical protein